MKFDDLDKKLRIYETINDCYVLPGIFMVARIDGRSFTRLTKEIHQFESPFDVRFRDLMVGTVVHLMDCGFRVLLGHTQSDEISLLFHLDEDSFGRKLRKLNSVLAGEASAKFSTLLGAIGAFDCRICQLPSAALVIDYFRWRQEDAHRNALNAHCYWTLRKLGDNPQEAHNRLSSLSVAEKNELLLQKAGMNFNDLPLWQRRGIGFYWEEYEKSAVNPVTGTAVTAPRRRLKIDMELPMRDELSAFVAKLIAD
ncbi:MAG: tRNA(His) guanylyltransferase Thg1 family protein [Gammaproteobacteria bacterium]